MYDKNPYLEINDESIEIFKSSNKIVKQIKNLIGQNGIIAFDFYYGVDEEEIKERFISKFSKALIINTDEVFFEAKKVTDLTKKYITSDRTFGVLTNQNFTDFIDVDKLNQVREKIKKANGLVIIYGLATALVADANLHLYFDITRTSINEKLKTKTYCNWKVDNENEEYIRKYKRGYFLEWPLNDHYKRDNLKNIDYFISKYKNDYTMISKKALAYSINCLVNGPFRLVPIFNPSVWGGQWMKEKFGLDKTKINYGWCFDCVFDENSFRLKINKNDLEFPAFDILFFASNKLLGSYVNRRFKGMFPIRFDILDTWEGQNLSIQVHPTLNYAKKNFNIPFTQDESYYILDAKIKSNPQVYIGFKKNVAKADFFGEINEKNSRNFKPDKYINKKAVKRHDHILIPAGTIHGSGKDTVVLEISATPSIFTFKLYDWNRLGLNNKPRPINLARGKDVLDFTRDEDFVSKELFDNFQVIKQEKTNLEEKTGLHKLEFIETRRNWFSDTVHHYTNGNLNVLNLISGAEAIVTSPNKAFEPFIVHYAETFIIPATVSEYCISPHGSSKGKKIATIKAYVREET